MGALLSHVSAFVFLFVYGLYHLISAVRSHHIFRPPPSSKPYYAIPISPNRSHLLRHLPLYLTIAVLLFSTLHSFVISTSTSATPFPTLRVATFQSTAVLLLFLLLAAFIILLPSLPSDLVFLLASLAFLLLSFSSNALSAAYPISDLQSVTNHLSSLISLFSAAAALSLAINPSLFIAEVAIASSVCLQGLWSLQSGMMLYVDAFIPEGCHRLMDVNAGIDGSTRCDLEESRVRALGVMDLAFVVDVLIVTVIVVGVYAAVVKACAGGGGGGGGGGRRGAGAYEALPTTSSVNEIGDHLQMKAIGKNAMQA